MTTLETPEQHSDPIEWLLESTEQVAEPRHAPAWIFAITNLPFGVSGSFTAVAMPFFLNRVHLPLGDIAQISALIMIPAWLQFLWAPIIDLWIRRRLWLVLMSVIGGVLLGAAMLLPLPSHLLEYKILLLTGSIFSGLVGSCNGALVSTVLPDRYRGQAAGWVNAGNLGAGVLGGGVVLSLARYSVHAAALGVTLMVILPSLVALLIPEPEPSHEPLGTHLGAMVKDIYDAVRAPSGWTGLILCMSPVGTVALNNLFSGMGNDYHVGSATIEWLNGYGGGFITAFGSLVAGFLLDRINRRTAYLATGVLSALAALGMAMGRLDEQTFVIGCVFYMFVTGLAFAAFSAFVYEIVGTAGKTAGTLYSVFPAAGNFAIWYVIKFDGWGHDAWGPRGMLLTDAALNLAGVAALMVLFRVLRLEARVDRDAEIAEGIPEVA